MSAPPTRAEFDAACQTLGVDPATVTEAAARAALRIHAQQHHPDKASGSTATFARLSAAATILKAADWHRPDGEFPGPSVWEMLYRTAPDRTRAGRTARHPAPPTPVADPEIPVVLSLSTVLFGGDVLVHIPTWARCRRPTPLLLFGSHGGCPDCRGTGYVAQDPVRTIRVNVPPGGGLGGPIRLAGIGLPHPEGVGAVRLTVTLDGGAYVREGRIYTYGGGYRVIAVRGIPYPRFLLGGEIPVLDPYGTEHRVSLEPGSFVLGSDDEDESPAVVSTTSVPGGIPLPDGTRGPMTVVGIPTSPRRPDGSAVPPTQRVRRLLWELLRELDPTTVIPEDVKPRRRRSEGPRTPRGKKDPQARRRPSAGPVTPPTDGGSPDHGVEGEEVPPGHPRGN